MRSTAPSTSIRRAPLPHLNEAMTMFDRQQYTAADDQFLKAVALGLPNAENYFIDFAALYRDRTT